MKTVKLTKSIIEQTLNITVPFTDPRDENANCVFISVNDGKMEIEATNFGESIRSKNIPCSGDEVVSRTAVDGKRLLQVVKAMNSDEVTMQFDGEELIVKQGRTRFKIGVVSTNNIKEIKFPHGVEMSLNSEHFKGMERVLHTIDGNNANHNLSGLQMEIAKQSVTFVGTDTKRLAAVKYAHSFSGDECSILLPKRSCISMLKLFGGMNISAYADDVNFTVETESVSYSTRLINGKFPDWKRIMGMHRPNIAHSIQVNSEALFALASQAGIIKEEAEVIIKNGELSMNSENAKTQQSMEASIAVDYQADEEIAFGVNIRFLLDFISATGDESLTLNFIGTASPFFLEASSIAEILMPIVLTQKVAMGEAA